MGVSRKFVYQQAHTVQAALTKAFDPEPKTEKILLSVAGPEYAVRRELFDFVVAELRAGVGLAASDHQRRLARPVRRILQGDRRGDAAPGLHARRDRQGRRKLLPGFRQGDDRPRLSALINRRQTCLVKSSGSPFSLPRPAVEPSRRQALHQASCLTDPGLAPGRRPHPVRHNRSEPSKCREDVRRLAPCAS